MLSTRIFLSGLSGSTVSIGPPMTTGLKPSSSASSVCQLTRVLNSFGPPGVQAVDHVFGEHVEEREVEGVDAFAEDRPLPTALAGGRLLIGTHLLTHKEAAGVLEVVARNHTAQRLAGAQGLAVAWHRRNRSYPGAPSPGARDESGTATASRPKCRPPRSTSAWKPASPFRAMIPPSGTDPLTDHSFSTMPTRLLAMYRRPVSSHRAHHAHDQAHQPEHSDRQVRQGRDDRRNHDEPIHGTNRCHILNTVAIPRLNSFGERTRENCSNRNNP